VKAIFRFCCFLVLASGLSFAQANEVSFSAGATFTSEQNVTSTLFLPAPCVIPNCNVLTSSFKANTAFTFAGSYSRRLLGAGPVALSVELPFLGTPGHGVSTTSSSGIFGTINGSSSATLFFFTPSARITFLPASTISPWLAVGGGWARLTQGGQNSNSGAVQFGGGADFKTGMPHLRIRAEVRDFWAGNPLTSLSSIPEISTMVSPDHQHHIFAGGGVVVKF
jgi:hypothetical protein